ncbi:LacI family DNA-binding transcriptional regulator [Arthrobacter sp. B2a2-09]|uniref:LacI family DNA-binding transcriptional regulator n=1 Tax=Arthrobacter sp. B2a2-09 TaxID=2952822 RepID=UPI0022CDA29A|nr:LacI family DNA-binding transcriptional regulator [Arthrobacter sp. B2a2-09]MCZ9880597.1 LacI family transcriptional regulator [Arthrobacter sp. B2a2-09]
MPEEIPVVAPAANGGRRPRPTINDIARLAEVNPSTVSRALNRPGRVNARTEERIRKVAADLNYTLNPMARALPTGRSNTLGLILSDITNPAYFGLVRGAQRVAMAEGFTLVLAESQESPQRELEKAQRILRSVDGLVLVGTRLSDEEIQALRASKPLVLINREVSGVPAVVPDIAPGIRDALAHLAEIGHRSLAFVSGPSHSWISRRRWDHIMGEALSLGMSIVEIGPKAPSVDGGRDCITRVLASGVTTVITYNDLMAIGLLNACREHDVDVPGRLSIIGFDDIFGSDFTSPPITTIRTPFGRAGDVAMRRLVAAVTAKASSEQPNLSTEFVLRGSTARPGQRRAFIPFQPPTTATGDTRTAPFPASTPSSTPVVEDDGGDTRWTVA